MNNTFKIYIALFVLVIGLLTLLESSKKTPVNWRKNFHVEAKSSFGLFVFNKEADSLLHQKLQRISTYETSPYEYYSENDSIEPHNILMVQEYMNDAVSFKKILEKVASGSDLLYFHNRLSYDILDTLSIKRYNTNFQEGYKLRFTDTKLLSDTLVMSKLPDGNGIAYIGEENEILGTMSDYDEQPKANFVRVPHGKGNIYIHTEPLVLTNYYLLEGNSQRYVQDVFSYLPDRTTLWFSRNFSPTPSYSPLRFVLDNPPLRYAWWLFLGGLLLFAIFNAKRRQRIVPIIEPPQNKSVEFVKSVGNLYLQEGNPQDMADKKIQYFLQKVRTELMIDTQRWDANFVQKLHVKTGISVETIQKITDLMQKLQHQRELFTEKDLTKLNEMLNKIIK
ncbi:MAG: hypothetical protein Q4G08_02475 [Capnocytophaga sp.]|nr:hypothetical protein [Capnocytophaga sp.]